MRKTYLSSLAGWTQHIREGRVIEQAAALCSRVLSPDAPEILLLTSRDSRRWVLPKGTIEKNENSSQAAVREAFEEAGVRGRATGRPLGHYTYVKQKEGVVCIVAVHQVVVHEILSVFDENDQRTAEWVSVWEAARRIREPELKGLIALLAP